MDNKIDIENNGLLNEIMQTIENNKSKEVFHMEHIRVINFPAMKMVRSEPLINMEVFEEFDKWWSKIDLSDYITPRDFIYVDEKKKCMYWLIAVPKGFEDNGKYELIDFPGGLYAVGTSKDADDDDKNRVKGIMRKWIADSGCFKESDNRYEMSHVCTPKIFKDKTGYHLMDLFIPIEAKDAFGYYIACEKRLSSPDGSKIVNLLAENRNNVIEISNPKSWAVVSYDLNEYKNQNITLSFSAEVKRTGAAGTLNWSINNSDYPAVGEVIDSAAENVWHKMSGTWTGVLTADYPFFFLGTYVNNSEQTIYHIDKFEINIASNKPTINFLQ